MNQEPPQDNGGIGSPPDRIQSVDETPYGELDGPVVALCRALNALPGIWTIGSCGGHEGGGQDSDGRNLPAGELPANEWRVTIHPDLESWTPTPDGWLSLEFVAWVVYEIGEGKAVELSLFSRPPFLNEPAHMLRFNLHGWRDAPYGITPEEVAASIERFDREIYRPEA